MEHPLLTALAAVETAVAVEEAGTPSAADAPSLAFTPAVLILATELESEESQRLAGARDALPLLLRAATCANLALAAGRAGAEEAATAVAEAVAALLKGQPDLVTPPSPDTIIASGEANANVHALIAQLTTALTAAPGARTAAARSVRYACTLHEANRQAFVTAGVVPLLLAALRGAGAHGDTCEGASASGPAAVPSAAAKEGADSAATRTATEGAESAVTATPTEEVDATAGTVTASAATGGSASDDPAYTAQVAVVREAARALRVLTFDDDVRVAFGKGHEHAKLVVDEHSALPDLIAALRTHQADAGTAAELASTLGRLAVRNEYCQDVVDLGGLDLTLASMQEHAGAPPVAAACLSLLRAIAGNDDVKARIQKAGGIAAIIEAMERHMQQAGAIREEPGYGGWLLFL